MIRGIIFDCFGVLYSGSLSLLASLAPRGREQDIYDINAAKDYGYITHQQYIEQIGEVIGKTPQEVDEIMARKHVRNAELLDYARELSGEYKLALLSNIGEQMFERLFQEADRELFREVFLSYREGIAKPNPAVFRLVASRLGLTPDECVMIDDIAENCDGAASVGMQTILHTTNSNTRTHLREIIEKSI